MKQTKQAPTAVLQSQPRKQLGSRTAAALRALGRIPSSLELTKTAPHVDFSIDADEFLTARRRHQHVFELDFAGNKEAAIVRHLDWDTFGESIIHVEFRRVDLKKKTEVEVDLHFVGHPKGVLNQLVAHVKVLALPTEIPDELEVSVADLEPGTSVTAAQIKLPANVDLVTNPAATVARISEIKIEVVAAPVAPEAAAGATAGAAPGAAAGAAAGGAAGGASAA
ncbi:MAG: 50S ribosomal protein L25, partial [Planctomycetes bacterium]|nr:50S ribosomal protein L25 [Planctomycetota bacterium]